MQYQLQLARVFVYDWGRALASCIEALGMPVARGARFLEPPNQHVWGAMMANFEDPDRNGLTLIGPGGST